MTPLTQHASLNFILRAIFCFLRSDDLVAATKCFDKFKGAFPAFPNTTEGKFTSGFITFIQLTDSNGFEKLADKFDKSRTLDKFLDGSIKDMRRNLENSNEDELL